jgi:hypothetical protein
MSQFHRYTWLVINERGFHLEVATVMVKLMVTCEMPRELLLRNLRRLLFTVDALHAPRPATPPWLPPAAHHALRELR